MSNEPLVVDFTALDRESLVRAVIEFMRQGYGRPVRTIMIYA